MASKLVYVCGVDFQHEIGEVPGWSGPMYTSIEECKKFSQCWQECGIMEIEIKFSKWVEPQQLFNSKKGDSNA